MSKIITFVIGTGANKKIGLKTGEELKDSISKSLGILFDKWRRVQISGDELIYHSLNRYIHAQGWE